MGMITAPKECFITGAPTIDQPSSYHNIEYFTEYAGQKFFFCFNPDHVNSAFVNENRYILQGLIINDKFPYDEDKPTFNNNKLERIIREANIPSTPKERLDNIIQYLYLNQEFEGGEIKIDFKIGRTLYLPKLYFKRYDEYWFYLNTLKQSGLITFMDATSLDGNDAIDIHLTFSGLEYVINLQESGGNSNKSFVAISFAEEMHDAREAIKEAIISSGYKPVLIDEVHYDSEITINDAIIRYIKECRFLIADFSGHRHGVYFEAGYALGQGKQVIYLCSEKDFSQSHFDTNHYPHIVYKDTNDLKIKLENKIKAWVI